MTLVERRATLRRMKYAAGVLVCVVATASLGDARADDLKPITIVAPTERPMKNKLTLAGLAGASLLSGAIGLYFHLDSRSASDDVATDVFTGTPWTREHQDLVDRANSSRTAAIAMYGVGGAFLIGSIVYWIVTDPPDETIVIQPRAQASITPTPGGAVFGGTWSF